MMGAGKNIEAPENSVFNRYDSAKLKEFNVDKGPSHSPCINAERRDSALQRFYFGKTLNEFLANEKVAGVLYRSWRQGGLINIFGRDHRVGKTFPVSALVIEAEHYNSLSRMIDSGKKPKVTLDIDARFHDEDRNAYHTIAEITGSDTDHESFKNKAINALTDKT